MRSGGDCRTDMSWANRCRCSRELRAHDLEGPPLCRPKKFRDRMEPVPPRLQNYWTHSSKAAGSTRKYASASPAKWSEPVSRIRFGLAWASSNASATDDVME